MQFQETGCSNCGATFGPGNSGFSHCQDHRMTYAEINYYNRLIKMDPDKLSARQRRRLDYLRGKFQDTRVRLPL